MGYSKLFGVLRQEGSIINWVVRIPDSRRAVGAESQISQWWWPEGHPALICFLDQANDHDHDPLPHRKYYCVVQSRKAITRCYNTKSNQINRKLSGMLMITHSWLPAWCWLSLAELSDDAECILLYRQIYATPQGWTWPCRTKIGHATSRCIGSRTRTSPSSHKGQTRSCHWIIFSLMTS